jgi:NADH:ubiquinone oxidoreductase subunit H
VGVYGIMIGGWASNKFSLMGLFVLHHKWYEVAMGLSMIAY